MQNNVFTKKMAGVIFKAWKEGKIKMTDENVKEMYNDARCCENQLGSVSYSQFYSNQNYQWIDTWAIAVEDIFAGNYQHAQSQINGLFEFRENVRKRLNKNL